MRERFLICILIISTIFFSVDTNNNITASIPAGDLNFTTPQVISDQVYLVNGTVNIDATVKFVNTSITVYGNMNIDGQNVEMIDSKFTVLEKMYIYGDNFYMLNSNLSVPYQEVDTSNPPYTYYYDQFFVFGNGIHTQNSIIHMISGAMDLGYTEDHFFNDTYFDLGEGELDFGDLTSPNITLINSHIEGTDAPLYIPVDNIVIENNTFYSSNTFQEMIYASGNNIVIRNNFFDIDGDAIYVYGNNVTFSNNIVLGDPDDGVLLSGGNGHQIYDNNIKASDGIVTNYQTLDFIRIFNNSIESTNRGISIASNHAVVEDNKITSTGSGISSRGTNDTVFRNTVNYGDSVGIEVTSNSFIFNNTIIGTVADYADEGITVGTNSVVANNSVIVDNAPAFRTTTSSAIHLANNSFSSQTDTIVFYDMSGMLFEYNEVYSSSERGLYLTNCRNNEIRFNNFVGNQGVQILESHFNTFVNNTMYGTSYGFYAFIDTSWLPNNNNTLENNTIIGVAAGLGAHLYFNNATIRNNYIRGISGSGIHILTGKNSTITKNTIVANITGIYHGGTKNTISYNQISYGINSLDLNTGNTVISNTLTKLDILSPVIISKTQDHSVLFPELSDEVVFWQLNDTNAAEYTIYMNDVLMGPGTSWTNMDTITFENIIFYGFSQINITLVANDTSGNTLVDTILLDIIFDTTNPALASQHGDSMITAGSVIDLSWTITEENPDMFVLMQNGSIIYSGVYQTGDPVTYQLADLEPGNYAIEFFANDTSGNQVVDEFTLSVEPFVEYIDPEIVPNQYETTYTEGDLIQLFFTISDDSNYSYSVLINGTAYNQDDITLPSVDIEVVLSDYEIGTYNITIVAEDIYGNSATQSYFIEIIPIPPATSTTSSTSSTTSSSTTSTTSSTSSAETTSSTSTSSLPTSSNDGHTSSPENSSAGFLPINTILSVLTLLGLVCVIRLRTERPS